ncbi:MAG: hypothetical protein OXF20_08325, partial [Gammaproteobacteria bacterium]|nr:hypothetical protein [Gammaproteobacteria bacterium]
LADRQASGHQNLDLASFIAGQLAAALAHDSSPLCLTWRLSSARWPFATRRHPTGCCTSEWNWGWFNVRFKQLKRSILKGIAMRAFINPGTQ